MAQYRNITVDINTPTTVRDRTAVGILTALLRSGTHVDHATVDSEIVSAGGRVAHKSMAMKGLRNLGFAIVASKARHLSWYRLAATPDEYDDFVRRIVAEAYSQQVTVCRTLAGAVTTTPNNPSLNASHQHAIMAALSMGQQMGKTIYEVLAEVDPLPAP